MSEQFQEGIAAKRARDARERQKVLETSFNASRTNLPAHVVLMVIAFDGNNCQVQGPIANKALSYMMLNFCHESIMRDPNGNLTGSAERPMEGVDVLVIAFDQNEARLSISGSCNKAMAYSMLELARDCIYDYNKERIAGVIDP